jgi:hypothetical protein
MILEVDLNSIDMESSAGSATSLRATASATWCRPKKTCKRRRAFHIPLATTDALEFDRWAGARVTFTNSRWLKPINRFREYL